MRKLKLVTKAFAFLIVACFAGQAFALETGSRQTNPFQKRLDLHDRYAAQHYGAEQYEYKLLQNYKSPNPQYERPKRKSYLRKYNTRRPAVNKRVLKQRTRQQRTRRSYSTHDHLFSKGVTPWVNQLFFDTKRVEKFYPIKRYPTYK